MKKKNIYGILVLGLSIAFISCTNSKSTDKENAEISNNIKNDSSALKVYLDEEKRVLVNGKEIETDSLEAYISSQKNKISRICFSRYDAKNPEAPKEFLTVIEILAKQNLGLTFYGDSTYSTSISGN